MGCWDTVASMIVPGPKLLSLPRLRTLPYTRHNPSVRAFRHAMAIDERRRMFRLNWWKEGQTFYENPFSKPPATRPQDCRQLWFPGVHADVGGGYPEAASSLSKWPLIWMISEAVAHGLRINDKAFRRFACGQKPDGTPSGYAPPNACGPMHRSLRGFFWWLIEFIPKSSRWREWRNGHFGLYLPLGEPRVIVPEAELHYSAVQRLAATRGPGSGEEPFPGLRYPPYRPVNLEDRRPYLPPEREFSRVARTVVLLFVSAALMVLTLWATLLLWGRDGGEAPQCLCREAQAPPATVLISADGSGRPETALSAADLLRETTGFAAGLAPELAGDIISRAEGPIVAALSKTGANLTTAGTEEIVKDGLKAIRRAGASPPHAGALTRRPARAHRRP
jgi:hypothetical protein